MNTTNTPHSAKTRVLLLDDHPVLLQGIANLIQGTADLAVCWQGTNSSEVWEAIERERPEIAVIDVSMEGTDGIELTKNLIARWPDLKILILSVHDEALYAGRALRAGAKGFIMKREDPMEIVNAVRRVLKGEVYLSEPMQGQMVHEAVAGRPRVNASPVQQLSDRELEVFKLYGQGCGTRLIAERLGLSVKTVETYRANIKAKLNIKESAQLVVQACQWYYEGRPRPSGTQFPTEGWSGSGPQPPPPDDSGAAAEPLKGAEASR